MLSRRPPLNDDSLMDTGPARTRSMPSRRYLHLRRAAAFFLLPALYCAPSFGGESATSSNTVAKAAVSAAQAISAFRLEPGFKMELVAGEPMISSPVAMAFDEDGRLFVIEMPGSSLPGEASSVPGRVR